MPVPPSQPTAPTLEHAYRQTWYWVDALAQSFHAAVPVGLTQRWHLQIDQHQPLLQAAYQWQRCSPCATYLTACNPHGRLLSVDSNRQRMQQLCQQLGDHQWHYTSGFGQDPQDLWPGEPSVLIWGMDADTALRWARQWEQNAFLHCAADGVPRLLWTSSQTTIAARPFQNT